MYSLYMHCNYKLRPISDNSASHCCDLSVSVAVLSPKGFDEDLNQLPVELRTPTHLVNFHAYCCVYQNTEGDGVQLNNFNQNCEIAAKCCKFGMQNRPLMK